MGNCVLGMLVGPSSPAALLTSRMKNLAVFTLAQVFFSLETGLMFMPAGRGMAELCRARLAGKAIPEVRGCGGHVFQPSTLSRHLAGE